MSTAKMMADSTQSDIVSEPPAKSRKKKSTEKKARKSRKSGKKVIKKKPAKEENLLSDPDLDLSTEVKDISEYLKDRQEMVTQMFHAVQGASLQRALPDVLKGMSLEVLQQKCLEHLEVMSKKRIRRILNGDDPATISSSGTEDETTDDETDAGSGKETTSQVADSTSQAGEQSSQDLSAEGAEGGYGEEVEMEGVESDAGEWRIPPPDEGSEIEYEETEAEEEENKEASDEGEVEEVEAEEEVEEEVEEMEEEESEKVETEADDASKDSKASSEEEILDEEVTESVKKKLTETPETDGESLIPMLTKNQMELLELEMRARAIKAMLRKHQGKSKPDS